MHHKERKLKVGFIGAGQMAKALGEGFVRSGILEAQDVFACDVSAKAMEDFLQRTGGRSCDSPAALAENCDLVFLAVKPQHVAEVLEKLRSVAKIPLLVSIAAGISLDFLSEKLGEHVPLVRVMPNTPALVGSAASGFTCSASVSAAQRDTVRSLLETVGIAEEVPEKLMDAVTGLSGSGPAFAYVVLEAMSEGGVRMGLPRDVAIRLAAQTLKGAAEMVLQSGDHPAVLKDRVCSPGGTTIEGVCALEKAAVRSGILSAVIAAAERSAELQAKTTK